MPFIETCLSPALIHSYFLPQKNVVIIDILRATSTIVTVLAEGGSAVLPVSSIEECRQQQAAGYTTAAERDGSKVAGFDFGNSPLEYRNSNTKGLRLALSSTNGTQCVELSKAAHGIYCGAFLNLSALALHLAQQQHDVLLLCAGWKNAVNAEDTLFAGALAQAIISQNPQFQRHPHCDSTLIALQLWQQLNFGALIRQSSHFHRLAQTEVRADLDFCLQCDVYTSVPVYEGGVFVAAAPTF
ncbi:MAG: 2-phosphosulfolactate phosphatase [Sphingobacteriales bacterium]|nr:2-phosphosulfolactate phosphatase [Sphingobacteriales bacterium]